MTALLKNLAGDLHQLTSSANGEKGVLGEGGTRVGGVGGRLQLGPSPSTPHPLSTPPHPPSTPPPPPLNSPPSPRLRRGADPERALQSLAPTALARTAAGSARRRRAQPRARWAGTGITSPSMGGASPSAAAQVAASAWCRCAEDQVRERGVVPERGPSQGCYGGEGTVSKPLNKQNTQSSREKLREKRLWREDGSRRPTSLPFGFLPPP